jgi:hypothetical protein
MSTVPVIAAPTPEVAVVDPPVRFVDGLQWVADCDPCGWWSGDHPDEFYAEVDLNQHQLLTCPGKRPASEDDLRDGHIALRLVDLAEVSGYALGRAAGGVR